MRYVVECDWRGARRILRNMQHNLRRYARREILAVAENAVREARSNAPVRTGELKDSIHAQHEYIGGTGIMIALVADTHYAVCQEKGFTHMPDGKWVDGKFFLRDALESHKPMFASAINSAMRMAAISKEAGPL